VSFTIYPAIDLRAGKVVRLIEGDPARMTSYSDDPAQTVRQWLSLGARWLHVVNLDGAFSENDSANQMALRGILEVAKEFGAQIQFGGGMRSAPDIQRALDLGVSRIVLGTIAIRQPDVVLDVLRNALPGEATEQQRVAGQSVVLPQHSQSRQSQFRRRL